jgi:multiple sugar transport system permease protein
MNATKRRSDLGSAIAFTSPNVLGFLIFLAGPLLVSMVMAFTNWDLRKTVPLKFVGFRNFYDLLTNNDFWVYFVNTLYFMLAIPFSVAGSLILALLLNKPLQENTIKGRVFHGGIVLLGALVIGGALRSMGSMTGDILAGMVLLGGCLYFLGVFTGIVVYRTAYYLPSFVSGVASIILWKALYNSENGAINGMITWFLDDAGINRLLTWLHIGPWSAPKWLSSTHNLMGIAVDHLGFDLRNYFGLGAREAIMIMGVATSIGGGNMLLYLAGLSNIPPELYEAADIDGANPWQRFWNVTWPQLAPTTFFITIMSCIGGLQGGFDTAKVMTNGGPSGTTTTLSFYIYSKAFLEFRLGYSCALAWVLFLIVFFVTAVNWNFGNKRMNE